MLLVTKNKTVQVSNSVKPPLETDLVCCLVFISLFLFWPPACNEWPAKIKQSYCVHSSVRESSFATTIQAK